MMDQEKRNSQLKQNRKTILEGQYSALMNDTKWLELLDRVHMPFWIKTIDQDEEKIEQVYELEQRSLLYKSNGDFTEFFEIEYIRCRENDNLLTYLAANKIAFERDGSELVIYGYKK